MFKNKVSNPKQKIFKLSNRLKKAIKCFKLL